MSTVAKRTNRTKTTKKLTKRSPKKSPRKSPVKKVQRGVKKVSNRPKRALNAFFIYMNENRARIRRENPTITIGEVAKVAKAEWDNMKANAKVKYERLAQADLDRYNREMANYVPRPEDKIKRKKKDPNAPKKPNTAYIFYFSDRMASLKGTQKDMKPVVRKIGEEWRKLSERDKRPYRDMAERDKERYEREMGRM